MTYKFNASELDQLVSVNYKKHDDTCTSNDVEQPHDIEFGPVVRRGNMVQITDNESGLSYTGNVFTAAVKFALGIGGSYEKLRTVEKYTLYYDRSKK